MKTCMQCRKDPFCLREKNICEYFELYPELILQKLRDQINSQTKKAKYNHMYFTLRKYITDPARWFNTSNITFYYSIDQDKFLKKNVGSKDEFSIGNWIRIPLNKLDYFYIKMKDKEYVFDEILFTKLVNETFEIFYEGVTKYDEYINKKEIKPKKLF